MLARRGPAACHTGVMSVPGVGGDQAETTLARLLSSAASLYCVPTSETRGEGGVWR